MRRFILRTLLMATGLLACLAVAFVAIPAGKLGDVYPRVTSPAQQSLVIGTSRAAQDVNPAILNASLKDLYPSADLYNFAFHLDESTYNEEYIAAIRKKLAPHDGKKHLFVLAVDPWQFKADPELYGHLDLHSVTSRPNVEFLLRHFERSWFSLQPSHVYINEQGRTEVDYEPRTAAQKAANTETKLAVYREMAATYRYSTESERLMAQLATELKRRGDVVLVRLPSSAAMVDIERGICTDFTSRMHTLASQLACHYYDFSTQHYDSNDGNHLTRQAGDDFSHALADSLRLASHDGKK